MTCRNLKTKIFLEVLIKHLYVAITTYVLICGIIIIAGTKVLFGLYALHHHAGVWGDDVEVSIMYRDHTELKIVYFLTLHG